MCVLLQEELGAVADSALEEEEKLRQAREKHNKAALRVRMCWQPCEQRSARDAQQPRACAWLFSRIWLGELLQWSACLRMWMVVLMSGSLQKAVQ